MNNFFEKIQAIQEHKEFHESLRKLNNSINKYLFVLNYLE